MLLLVLFVTPVQHSYSMLVYLSIYAAMWLIKCITPFYNVAYLVRGGGVPPEKSATQINGFHYNSLLI